MYQTKFFKESKDNPNVFYYYFRTDLPKKLLGLLIIWGIALITLYLSIVQLSVSKDYILKPFVKEAIVVIPIEFILIYFGWESLGSIVQRKRPVKHLTFPGFSNYKVNLSFFILFCMIYLMMIQFYWIGNLPNGIRADFDFQWIYPSYSFFAMAFFQIFFWFGLTLLLMNTKFILDKESGFFIFKGTTSYRQKYSVSLHLDQPITIVIQPYRYLLNPDDIGIKFIPEPNEGRDLRRMGIFLFLNDKKYLIHTGVHDYVLTFAEQLSSMTNWKIIEKNEIFYDTGSNLDLVVR